MALTLAKKKSKSKPQRARTGRRVAVRRHVKLVSARRRLQAVEPGGSCDKPIEVESASQISVFARQLGCAGCEAPLTVDSETAGVVRGRVMRTVELYCRRCGEVRKTYFAVAAPSTN